MKLALLLAAALLWSGSALAQHKHGDAKGPNGGPMQDIAGVHAELVATGTSVTVNIFDEATKPISTKGFSGSALIVAGADRETVMLAPSGENTLKGEARKAIAAGAAVTVVVKTAAGKSGQARF
ncbi:hypothetical protein FHP25_04635 [Vineibacter terrae]|uniref:DUF5666 domain-containing protein n=1 Tax=Vineibacter terrae TaxID=2586908 RepID=A0A5C8PSR7_9HYPH|nr:hypothetical protein [Vineibacter terrae]TXL80324.1 hypothetical protein FHP25_04635 [Vineibacter terrae]